MNLWQKIEQRTREKYNLDEAWTLYKVDLKDDEIAEVGIGLQNDKGKWLKGKENRREGFVIWCDLK
jgi:hypothetical protein